MGGVIYVLGVRNTRKYPKKTLRFLPEDSKILKRFQMKNSNPLTLQLKKDAS